MARQKKITKFSIGKFTNGAYVVRGFILKGILCGIVAKTDYPNLYAKGTYVEFPEFHTNNDVLPQFRKVRSFLANHFQWFLNIRNKESTKDILDLLTEISDLPTCAWKYKSLLDQESRIVLIEKFSQRNIFSNYINLNKNLELELIQIVSQKYGNIINDMYVSSKRRDVVGDIYTHNCTIEVPSLHSKHIFIELNTYRAMEQLYQIYIDSTNKNNRTKEGLEIFYDDIRDVACIIATYR